MKTIEPIAHMHSDFPEKFGIPRQSALVPTLHSTIVFTPAFRNPDALRGLEEFSHLWLIWDFSEAHREGWSPTVRPPRLGGNTRLGVFATRSPFRPNGLGLSCVELAGVQQHPELGPVLHVLGADLLDQTPIYDIKPYVPYADAHPQARGGFAHHTPEPKLQVSIPPTLRDSLSPETLSLLTALLALDPRPPYQQDPNRRYGMRFRNLDVRFSVSEEILTVHEIRNL